MAVDAARDRVEVLAEPRPYRPRSDASRRDRLLAEHARRFGDPSPGGSTAALLRDGPGSPRDLRVVAPDSGAIFLRNVYGWFERAGHGVYRLTSLGEAALQR